MQITVFGATGGIGRHVVDQLLSAGHDVVAYARTPAKLTREHARLRVVTGELTDRDRVQDAIQGSDAVISALGPSLRRGVTGTPVTDGTRTVVAAMQAAGVRRFVGLATPSLPDPRDRPTLKARVLPVLANLMFPGALRDLSGMTRAVTDSGLEWTIARITNPTNKPATGTVRAGFQTTSTTKSRKRGRRFSNATPTASTSKHIAFPRTTRSLRSNPSCASKRRHTHLILKINE